MSQLSSRTSQRLSQRSHAEDDESSLYAIQIRMTTYTVSMSAPKRAAPKKVYKKDARLKNKDISHKFEATNDNYLALLKKIISTYSMRNVKLSANCVFPIAVCVPPDQYVV
jgi:hypothetical protein